MASQGRIAMTQESAINPTAAGASDGKTSSEAITTKEIESNEKQDASDEGDVATANDSRATKTSNMEDEEETKSSETSLAERSAGSAPPISNKSALETGSSGEEGDERVKLPNSAEPMQTQADVEKAEMDGNALQQTKVTEDAAISSDGQHLGVALRRSGSLLDDAEDQKSEYTSGTDRSSSSKNNLPASAQKVSNLSLDGEEANTAIGEKAPTGKGAQILMNRFSTWRKKTNQTLSRNAQNLMDSQVGQSLKQQAMSKASLFATRAEQSPSKNDDAGTDRKRQQNDNKSMEDEDSASDSESTNSSSRDGRRGEGTDNEHSLTPRKSSMEDDESSESTDETTTSYQQNNDAARMAVKAAASGLVDSVASGFRGRYAAGSDPDVTPKRKGRRSIASITQSQTSLIMKSRAKTHMQAIIDSLAPHEYVMLLGSGMLGVNLKQTYLKHNGVYMDYFISGGAADSSGVVFVGDILVKVGETNVQKGTIHDVPKTIADAKRPVVLVFSTGMNKEVERIDFIDVAVAMMHRIRAESKERAIASMPIQTAPDNENNRQQDVAETDETKAGNDAEAASKPSETGSPPKPDGVKGQEKPEVIELDYPIAEIPLHSFLESNYMTPPLPSREVKLSLKPFFSKRCNDNFSLSMLAHEISSNKDFRAALRCAFLACALDGRRIPFVAAHFSSEEFYDTEVSGRKAYNSPQTMASTELMLFLELASFVDLYDVTPASRQRDIAERISYKFFLPKRSENQLKNPMFDFHNIVSDTHLRSLEEALGSQEQPIDRNLFVHFQEAVVDSLACQNFLSFLVANEAARMRGYLRNTAPYVNVPIRLVFDSITNKPKENNPCSNAHNHFIFMLMHLLCLTENEFGTENDDLRFGMSSSRVMGVAGGFCCAIFIERRLIPCIAGTRRFINESKGRDFSSSAEQIKLIVSNYNILWETFVAPQGGALDCFLGSSESNAALESVRSLLRCAVSFAEEGKDPRYRMIECLTSLEMGEALSRLSEELLYEYAVNLHPKYKEHKIHEWMCSEVCKGTVDLEKLKEERENQLPFLPPGSVKSLFRKLSLPDGVSSHKQVKRSVAQSTSPFASKDSVLSPNQNADFGIVFGTDDGLQISSRIPKPTSEASDVRRYLCQSVSLESNEESTQDDKWIPPTLESYATVPLFNRKPFSRQFHERLSADGWEISLIDFMIPTADEQSNRALHGVSLTFQKTFEAAAAQAKNPRGRSPIRLNTSAAVDSDVPAAASKDNGGEDVSTTTDKEDSVFDASGAFESPISFSSKKSDSNVDASVTIRNIKVCQSAPKFSRRLEEKPWLERVVDYKSSTSHEGPITVGVALASTTNNILVMRDTLSRLLLDHARSKARHADHAPNLESELVCQPLVDLLGNFSNKDVEGSALKYILEPYMRFASSPWIEKPLMKQEEAYCLRSGQQLIHSLPPIPLALLFVTAMLEQKLVFSSSRRSLLFAATNSLTELLKPLKWPHLLVPLVPTSLGKDLVQYPAPFVLGIPSEDPGNMELLNTLPDDVTLVDLDVGRVILAPSFCCDESLLRANDDAVTARALRSQVLYLSQALGVIFGSQLYEMTWCSDSILGRHEDTVHISGASFDKLKAICRKFLSELLSGLPSCCYSVEEKVNTQKESEENAPATECTVLCDEDRFFHIKNLRAEGLFQPLIADESYFPVGTEGRLGTSTGLALSLDDFDLVLESFLRCQSVSTFLSSISKKNMVYF